MACHGMRWHGMAWRGVACWLRVAWWAMSVRPLARPRRRRRKRRSKNPRRVSTSETRKRGDEERRNAGTQERRNEGTKVSSRNRTRVGCSSSQARRPLYYGRVERWSIPEKANILWSLDGSLRDLGVQPAWARIGAAEHGSCCWCADGGRRRVRGGGDAMTDGAGHQRAERAAEHDGWSGGCDIRLLSVIEEVNPQLIRNR